MLAWLKQRFSTLVETRSTKVGHRDTALDDTVAANLALQCRLKVL